MISKKRKQRITKSKARIKLGSSWLAYVGITVIALSIGFGFGYRLFDGRGATSFLMEIVELDSRNKKLEKDLVNNDLDMKVRTITYDKIEDEVAATKKENNELKEEILFYEKIVGKRKK